MPIQNISGSAGIIDVPQPRQDNPVAPFMELALLSKQVKQEDADRKKKEAQERASSMLTFAQQFRIYPQAGDFEKAIKEGWGFTPEDPAVVAQMMGNQGGPLGAKPNAVASTGKTLQNPAGTANVTPTTPAGSGVVQQGAAGKFVNPASTIDRSKIDAAARQRFGLLGGIAGVQMEQDQRQQMEDQYASFVADLHGKALGGDPASILNYQITTTGKVDPETLKALPFLTAPDKRKDLYQVMSDTEDAQKKGERKEKLFTTVAQYMGDQFKSPLDIQKYVNDVVDGKPTDVKGIPGKEKYKDTLDALEKMIGDPKVAGHAMDLWIAGTPLGEALDAVLPKNFTSLPVRKQLTDEANAISENIKAQADALKAAAEKEKAGTEAAKEARLAGESTQATKESDRDALIKVLTGPNAKNLDKQLHDALMDRLAPKLGVMVEEKPGTLYGTNKTYVPAPPLGMPAAPRTGAPESTTKPAGTSQPVTPSSAGKATGEFISGLPPDIIMALVHAGAISADFLQGLTEGLTPTQRERQPFIGQ